MERLDLDGKLAQPARPNLRLQIDDMPGIKLSFESGNQNDPACMPARGFCFLAERAQAPVVFSVSFSSFSFLHLAKGK
jgi:hypothetical protein